MKLLQNHVKSISSNTYILSSAQSRIFVSKVFRWSQILNTNETGWEV